MSTTFIPKVLIILFGCFVTICHGKTALLVIDVQNCFLPGGSLAVENGDQVIPIINSIRDQFDIVVLTQDWHCSNHVSFASQHPGHNIFDVITLEYDGDGHLCTTECKPEDVKHSLNQTLWPEHCVMDTEGAELKEGLQVLQSDIVIRKGSNCEVDSYSAFFDNGGFSNTELESKLIQNGVHKVFVSGLALDFCVFYSAMDADHLGFETYVIKDATRGISEQGINEALTQMANNDIKIINSNELKDVLDNGTTELMADSCFILVLLVFVNLFLF